MTDPSSTLPLGAERLTAPPIYASWFADTERCSGISGRYQAIQFYVVPGVASFETEIGTTLGLWSRLGGNDRIVIAGALIDNEFVVRHEMLHTLIGSHGHPEELFDQQCQLTWSSQTDRL